MNNSQPTLLLVDDDPFNLEILVELLEGAGYQTITASRGEEAWDILQQDTIPFQAVLLDRMMPGMDGMAVLTKMKTYAPLYMLPVIMQTAAASSEEIREGIEAGAFYYLTKPYTKEVLLAIVQAAVRDFSQHQTLQQALDEQEEIFPFLDSGQFHFQTLDQARTLALILAKTCPDPGRVSMGLMELLINAVEHGNLEISYEEKTRLQDTEEWEAEIAHRMKLPEFAHRQVRVKFHRRAEQLEFTITDEGPGFDWKRYLDMSPDMAFASHGRGIAMARALSFDKIAYQGNGNEVMCILTVDKKAGNESASRKRKANHVFADV